MKLLKNTYLIITMLAMLMVACKKDRNDPNSTPESSIPSISATDPVDNATDVVRNKVIKVTFTQDMDQATINTSTFTLRQGTTEFAGTVDYSSKVATFTPSVNMSSNVVYTAMISTAVKGANGINLSSAKEWSFTTGENIASLEVVNLGAAGNYAILAKTAINNNPTSSITGHIGLSPAATSYITGFALTDATGYATSAQVTGKIYGADMADPTPINLTTAVENMITAYNDAAGRPTPNFVELGTGSIGGQTLSAGLYKWTNTVTIPTNITISGGPNDVWIFQIAGDLTVASAVNVTLSGGAQAKNIFWQVAGEVTIGTTAQFKGIILSMTGVTLGTGATHNGRILAQTAVILDGNAVTQP
ncbi:MAG: ice-binding family protein [Cytophagaceae bacterium]